MVADLPINSEANKISFGAVEMKTGGGIAGHKPPPSVFEEPESSSLLDSFGF